MVGLVEDEPTLRAIHYPPYEDGAGMRRLEPVQPARIRAVRPLGDASRGPRQDVVEGFGQSVRKGGR